MSETVLALVDAIKNGDAIETETAFAAAMAEKLSSRIDDYRQQVAGNMFAAAIEPQQTEEPSQEAEQEPTQ